MVRTRLTLTVALSVAIVLAVFGFGIYKLAQGNLARAVDRELARRTAAINTVWGSVGRRVIEDPSSVSRFGPLTRQPGKVRRALFSQAFLLPKFFIDGRKTLFGGGAAWDEAAVDRSWRGEETVRTIRRGAETFRVATSPLRLDGQVKAVLQIAASLGDFEAEQARLAAALYTMIPAAIAATVLLSFLFARFALRPVGKIARSADRIQADNLSGRLPVQGRDEIANLSSVFNAVLDRLEAAFAAQRQFTANASHELRSPLAAIKLKAEIATLRKRPPEEYEESLREIVRSVDGMTALVADLLLLAQTDEGALELSRQPVVLRDLIEDVLLEFLTEGAPIVLDPSLDLEGSVDLRMFGRVIRNLVENARRHTPSDGRVLIRAERRDHRLVVEVIDNGEGIPAEALPHIFDRFYRADPSRDRSRGGAGLGLAICRRIVQAHGGTLVAESEPGHGTTFRIEIPAS